MHDGATPHTARVSQDYLHQAAIDVMLWPSISPDLNIMENIWSFMSRHINVAEVLPRSCVGLCTTLGWQWHRRAYVASWRVFDDGVLAVICARGGQTRYWMDRQWHRPYHFILFNWLCVAVTIIKTFINCLFFALFWYKRVNFISEPIKHGVFLCTSIISIPWNRNNWNSRTNLSGILKLWPKYSPSCKHFNIAFFKPYWLWAVTQAWRIIITIRNFALWSQNTSWASC